MILIIDVVGQAGPQHVNSGKQIIQNPVAEVLKQNVKLSAAESEASTFELKWSFVLHLYL